MRKIFTLLFSLLLSSVLSQVVAQSVMYVWNKGNVTGITPASVDSVTFSLDNQLRITTAAAEDVTTSSFKASGAVALSGDIKYFAVTPKVGVCYSSYKLQPTVNDSTVAMTSDFGEKSVSVSGLTSGTTYYYCVYAKLLDEIYYGNVCSVTTSGEKPVDHSGEINGHRFVDLALPSGLLWAETNIGADNPEDAGNYYAWGDTDTLAEYTGYTSQWYEKEYSGNLTSTDDVATVLWGNGVRIPTDEDLKELLNSDNCTWTWTEVNGMVGYRVVSKSNRNEIFLPAAGYKVSKQNVFYGQRGYYWTSAPASTDTKRAYNLYFLSSSGEVDTNVRFQGLPVRAVAEVSTSTPTE